MKEKEKKRPKGCRRDALFGAVRCCLTGRLINTCNLSPRITEECANAATVAIYHEIGIVVANIQDRVKCCGSSAEAEKALSKIGKIFHSLEKGGLR